MADLSIQVVDDQSSDVPCLKRPSQRGGIGSVPMIFVTARKTKESKREGLSAGAVDHTHPI